VLAPSRWVVLGGLGSIGKVHVANLKTLGMEPLVLDPRGSMEWDPQPTDAVVIASPSMFHESQVAELGSKVLAILVEKPPALTGNGWRTVRDACPRLAVAFNWRFHPIVEELVTREFDGFELEALENAHLFPGGPHLFDRTRGGGIVLTSGVHSIDLACYALGGPPVVQSHGSTDDMMYLGMEHPRGCSAIRLLWNWIGSENRRISAYRFDRDEVRMGILVTPCDMHLDMMRAFVEYAETGNPGKLCTAEQASWVMDVADAF
jgi:hypothetical protein